MHSQKPIVLRALTFILLISPLLIMGCNPAGGGKGGNVEIKVNGGRGDVNIGDTKGGSGGSGGTSTMPVTTTFSLPLNLKVSPVVTASLGDEAVKAATKAAEAYLNTLNLPANVIASALQKEAAVERGVEEGEKKATGVFSDKVESDLRQALKDAVEQAVK